MKGRFVIKGLGGKRSLAGTIPVRGAKNAVLKAMAASLLFADPVRLTNVPNIEDVARMAELLSGLGAKVERRGRALTIDPRGVSSTAVDHGISERLRASVVLSGPVLARFGSVSFPHPGGDVIGPRPIDIFLDGFRRLGARVTISNTHYRVAAPRGGLRGGDVFFPVVSVTATETLMLAAVLARGRTTLRNAAIEPEIPHLAAFLNRCGARVRGAGTPTIEIDGGKILRTRGKPYRTMSDRIETGSFLVLAALAGRDVTIADCVPEHVGILIDLLRGSGVPVEVGPRRIRVRGGKIRSGELRCFNVRTHEYPGFATDLQAPTVVYLTQASGQSAVFETIFENRLNYTADLVKMGADITVWDPQRLSVRGPKPLVGRELEGPDIRAGLAFLIAAVIAKGTSVIDNVYHIDRGYERIEERLSAIGARVERVS